MKIWHIIFLIILTGVMSSAYARSYSLPADIGSGAFSSCSGSGPVYNCTGSISLGEEDRVSITSNVTLNIDVNLYIDEEVSVNDNGFALNFNVTGNVVIDEDSSIDGNITAGGTISVDSDSNVSGVCSPAHPRCSGVPSGPSIDHFSITHAGMGVTCEAETITVTPHDASHVAMTPLSSTTITMSTSISNDGWALQSGNGTFNAPNQYTFNGVETSVIFWLTKTSVTAAPHMDIDITDGTASDLDGDVTEDINLEFRDTAFRFYADGSGDAIGTQIAGKSSDVAPDVQVLTLRAVQTNADTGACDARLAGTTQTVQMAFECVNPTICQSSNGVVITDTTLTVPTAISENPQGNVSTFSNVNLSFDTITAAVSWRMNYADAGQIALYVNLTIPAAGNDPADTFSGSSNDFVVRPFGFDIDSTLQRADDWSNGSLNGTGPSGTNTTWAEVANGSAFVKAGDNFNVTLRPVVWSAGDDSNNDGIPDAGANLTNNAITPNFGNEIVTERVDITHVKVLPVGAGTANGSLTGGNNLDFSGLDGTLTTTLSWDEVGIIDLTASLDSSDYLSGGSTVVSTHKDFGRFYPDHFLLSNMLLTNRSDLGCFSIFTYMGENLQLSYDLTAMNLAGAVTQNYTTAGGFARLDNSTELNYGAVDIAGPVDLSARLNTAIPVINFVAGVTSNLVDTLSLARLAAAADGPFSLSVGIAPADEDGVQLSNYNLDVNSDSTDDHGLISTTPVRYGRISLANAHGSELEPLTIGIKAQYYNKITTTFITNGDDNCTTYNVLDINLPGATYTAPLAVVDLGLTGLGILVNGGTTFSLHDNVDPTVGPGVTGSVLYDMTVPVYLQYDWDGDSLFTDNPAAKATFGIYNGNPKQIYYRQIYQ